jgi:hypothetical protein
MGAALTMRRTHALTRMSSQSTGKEPGEGDRQSLDLGVTHTAQEGRALECGGPRH